MHRRSCVDLACDEMDLRWIIKVAGKTGIPAIAEGDALDHVFPEAG